MTQQIDKYEMEKVISHLLQLLGSENVSDKTKIDSTIEALSQLTNNGFDFSQFWNN